MNRLARLALGAWLMAMLLAGGSDGPAGASQAGSEGWAIDRGMRFHLAYVPDPLPPREGAAETPATAGYAKPFLPDIDNIPLDAITGLGFTLPKRENPAAYKLYLKLYHFPASLAPAECAVPAIRAFRLDWLPSGPALTRFASEAANLFIKFGVVERADRTFTAEQPLPALAIQTGAGFAAELRRDVPFYSLYVTPGVERGSFATDDERAAHSAAGVTAFHAQLIEMLDQRLGPAVGPEPDTYFYYRDGHCVGVTGGDCTAVIRVPKQPMLFANWRELPMPRDPRREFLSGLLLIYRDESRTAADAAFPQHAVFEVGSVVALPADR